MRGWFRMSDDNIQVGVTTGVLGAVYGVVMVIRRLVEVIPDGGVPVAIELVEGLPAQLPLGAGGELVEVGVTSAVVQVEGLAGMSYAGVVGAAIVWPVVWVVVSLVGVGLLLAVRRGQVFTRGNSARIGAISLTVVAGGVVDWQSTNFAFNGALAVLGDAGDGFGPPPFDFLPWFVGMAIGAFAVVIHAGARMQRDTEGLV